MDNIFELTGGRKMFLSLLSIIALTLLAYFKPESVTTEFVTALIGLVTAFSASNVINTIKGAANLNQGEADTTTTAPTMDLYNEFLTLSEEVKVSSMNQQSQIDTTNARIEQLADIIQKSLLTKSSQSASLYTQTNAVQPTAEMSSVPRATETWGHNQAEINRQAINQYLTGQQPIR